MKCNHWSQNCHGGYPEVWKRCAERHGVECDQLIFEWHHYPDSPFGDVYICNHGVCLMADSTDSCKWCGNPYHSSEQMQKTNGSETE